MEKRTIQELETKKLKAVEENDFEEAKKIVTQILQIQNEAKKRKVSLCVLACSFLRLVTIYSRFIFDLVSTVVATTFSS